MTYSVLKVPLNPNQPTNQKTKETSSWRTAQGHKVMLKK